MTRARPALLAALLLACTPDDRSDTATTDATATTAPTTGATTASGDPPADEIGHCENYLPPITPAAAPDGEVGVHYALAFSLDGGDNGGVDWSIQTDELPPGLAFDPLSAILSGTPTAAGAYTFWIEAAVDDAASECPTKPESRDISLTIAP